MNGIVPQVLVVEKPEERFDISDLLILSLPIGVAFFLFKDEILRKLGLKKFLIIYFNDADYESAMLLKQVLGWQADVVKLSPTATTLPPEADEYKYIILIGGQTINPFYKKFMEMGYLPKVTPENSKVIKAIGNMIFIAGYEAIDTYEAVREFINKYLRH